MTKQKKFKGNQATYNITFEGIDLTIPNVMVKEVDIGNGNHWAMLDVNKDRWKLLTTPGYLIEPTSDDPQILTFDRTVPEAPVLVNGFAERLPIKVHTALSFKQLDDKIYSIDECPMGTRLQYTTSLIPLDQHNNITRIIFEKVSK